MLVIIHAIVYNTCMKVVEWTDDKGYVHRAEIRDYDNPNLAPEIGMPLDPPGIDRLDWEGIKRDLHNELVKRGLHSWQDVQTQSNALGSVLVSVMKRPLAALYKER